MKRRGRWKNKPHVHKFKQVGAFLRIFSMSRKQNGVFVKLECACGKTMEKKARL